MNESTGAPSQDLAKSVEEVARYWHADPYYDRAEQADWLGAFWNTGNPRRPFRRMFAELNLRSTAELACGHGRHAAQIYQQVPALILLDVVEENVAFCRKRFEDAKNVVAIKNDGCTFQPIPDESLTALFCYDAMVHFECDVALSYVGDAARVLQKGGRALLHHSILDAFPGRDHRQNPGGRNFMNHALFMHVARKAGFKILESTIMDWDAPHTDALTLLEKE